MNIFRCFSYIFLCHFVIVYDLYIIRKYYKLKFPTRMKLINIVNFIEKIMDIFMISKISYHF